MQSQVFCKWSAYETYAKHQFNCFAFLTAEVNEIGPYIPVTECGVIFSPYKPNSFLLLALRPLCDFCYSPALFGDKRWRSSYKL